MFKKIAIGTLCSVASLAFAQEGTMETTTMGTSPIKVFANVDLNITNIDAEDTTVDTGYGVTVGVDGVYMFTEAMGVGLGLDFNMITGDGETSGQKFDISANYLDIPVTFAYNMMATPDLGFMFLVGPYIGVPMGKWELESGGTTFEDKAETAIGANIETHATWTITEDFALGGHLGFKYAFNDLTTNDVAAATGEDDTKVWSLGLGLSAKFL